MDHDTKQLPSGASGSFPPPPVSRREHRATSADWWQSLKESVPTIGVFVALGTLLVWGHFRGWAMPRFSSLVGGGDSTAQDWCAEHDVPESICVMCKPELFKRASYGWCSVHGVHDCPLEHPDVVQIVPPPKITQADLDRAERALKLTNRPPNGHSCTRQEQLLQFVSQAAYDSLGIEVAPAWTPPAKAPWQEAITANGEVTYDPARVARLSSRAAGVVWRVEKKVGEEVQAGDVLAWIDSAGVGTARMDYLRALMDLSVRNETLSRLRSAGEAVAGKDLRAAEAARQEARVRWLAAQQILANLGLPLSAEELRESSPEKVAERVQFLGLSSKLAAKLKTETSVGTLIPVLAPFAGKIIARTAMAPDVIDTTKVLFTLADIRSMWITLDVNPDEAKLVSLGQPASFRTGGKHDDAVDKVSWISTDVDEKTRTVKVRIDVANHPQPGFPDGRLRNNSFGTGRIVLREEKEALLIPNEAVHWEGCCWVVFVRDKDFAKEGAFKVFHVRKVRVGPKDRDNTEIIAGLVKGEIVATKNSGVLRSALLKNSLGAG